MVKACMAHNTTIGNMLHKPLLWWSLLVIGIIVRGVYVTTAWIRLQGPTQQPDYGASSLTPAAAVSHQLEVFGVLFCCDRLRKGTPAPIAQQSRGNIAQSHAQRLRVAQPFESDYELVLRTLACSLLIQLQWMCCDSKSIISQQAYPQRCHICQPSCTLRCCLCCCVCSRRCLLRFRRLW